MPTCRYFHECEATDPRTIGEGGMEAGKASKPRFPLLNFPDTFPHGHPRAGQPHPLARQPVPYPHPEHETKGSLAMRAQLSAAALIALNEQVAAHACSLVRPRRRLRSRLLSASARLRACRVVHTH